MATETRELHRMLDEPEPVLLDGCIPGWVVGRSETGRTVMVRNAVSGLREELPAICVKPQEPSLPRSMQMQGGFQQVSS